MKIFKLVISSDNGFQTVLDLPPEELLKKDLYSEYKLEYITCIRLNLDKKAKITDVLNEGTLNIDGFPIKNKFCDILKKFNLLDIQFVDIIDKNLSDYKFMFFNSDLTYKLDFKKSNFILVEDMLGDIDKLDVIVPNNREGIVKTYKEYCVRSIFNRLVPENGYCFLPNFNIEELDVFRIGHFDKSFYISERVKNALESNNITGVEFVESTLFNNALS